MRKLPKSNKPFVGLTGTIGAGKTTALEICQRLGAATLSSDAVVHELYEHPDVRAAVTDRWGDQVAPGDKVDRAAVARLAFAQDSERQWLEQLLWPLVGAELAAWRDRLDADFSAAPIAVVEIPLLFEADLDRFFDFTVVVVTEEAVSKERAVARGHHFVSERGRRQFSQDEKVARATYVLNNHGSITDLERQVSDLITQLTG